MAPSTIEMFRKAVGLVSERTKARSATVVSEPEVSLAWIRSHMCLICLLRRVELPRMTLLSKGQELKLIDYRHKA